MLTVAGLELSPWMLFFLLFFIGPAMGWGWRAGHRSRASRDAPHPSLRRQQADLRALEAELVQRDAVIEALDARVAELENRLDFAERLLAAGRATAE